MLEEVYFAAGARVDLISLDYTQSKAGFRLHIAHDQLSSYLTKKSLKLTFKKIHGLYRI